MKFLSRERKKEEEQKSWEPPVHLSDFEDYVREQGFIAQERIIKELSLFVKDILDGNFDNFLFQAYSGYGKTTLALLVKKYLDPSGKHSIFYTPKDGAINFDEEKTIQIIDEAHKLKDVEQFYNYMISGKYVFIIATNEFDKLAEPFANRCIPYVFEPYETKHITQIIKPVFAENGLPDINDTWLEEFAKYGRNNPRVSEKNAKRIALLIVDDRKNAKKITEDNIFDVIKDYLNMERGGFNHYDRDYIEVLRTCGGQASLNLLVSLLQLPKNMITGEIEPFLIKQGLIQITPRGRKLSKGMLE